MGIKKVVCKTFYLIVLSIFIFIGISSHPFFSENKNIYSKNTAYSLRPPLVSDADLIAAYNRSLNDAAPKSTAISEESGRFIIEKAREDDLTELLEFRDKYFKEEITGYNEEFDVKLYRNKLANIIRVRDPGTVIIARSHGNIIGYAVSRRLRDSLSIGEIDEIAVHPGYRKRGIGKELFGLALDYLRSSPMIALVLVQDFSRDETTGRIATLNFGFSSSGFITYKLTLGDIDLRDRLGLPIRLTRGKINSVRSKKFFLRFGKKLAKVNPMFYSPNPTNGPHYRLVHYRSYCNVSKVEDVGRLINSNLSYDLLVLYPSHSLYTERGEKPISTGVHYPKKCEVVQIVFGDEAWLLLQKDVSEKGTAGEVEPCLIKVKEGQKVLIPPGYGYSIINPLSTKPLIVATWRHTADGKGKKQLYKEGKPAYVAEYYYKKETYEREIRFKPSIGTLPLLREIELESMQLDPGLAHEAFLYNFGYKPELLRKLIDNPIDRPFLITEPALPINRTAATSKKTHSVSGYTQLSPSASLEALNYIKTFFGFSGKFDHNMLMQMHQAFLELNNDKKLKFTRELLRIMYKESKKRGDEGFVISRKKQTGVGRVIALESAAILDLSIEFDTNSSGELILSRYMVRPGSTGPNAVRVMDTLGEDNISVHLYAFSDDSQGEIFSKILEESLKHISLEKVLLDGAARMSLFAFIANPKEPDGQPLELHMRPSNPILTESQGNELIKALSKLPKVKNDEFVFVIIAGQPFTGLALEKFYIPCIKMLKEKGYKVLGDCKPYMDVDEMEALVRASPEAIKMNLEEFTRFASRYFNKNFADLKRKNLIPEIASMVLTITQQNNIGFFIVSMEELGAVVVYQGTDSRGENLITAHIPAPQIRLKSSIGSGDSLIGAVVRRLTLDSHKHGRPDYMAAFLEGVAIGSATAEQEGTDLADAERVKELLEKIKPVFQTRVAI
nr:GNAT family N-acetyltransferase [Candidatus Omnitrophota bacterium]